MINQQYFNGVAIKNSDFENLTLIGNDQNDSWYVTNYSHAKSEKGSQQKKEIIEIYKNLFKKSTVGGEWHWHHIVEGQHAALAAIFGNIDYHYEFELPVILINDKEHSYFSSNFGSKAFFELAGTTKKSKHILQSEAQLLNKTVDGKKKIKSILNQMKELYQNIYQAYPNLAMIAQNILNSYSNNIV
jgi:hypothetical protein